MWLLLWLACRDATPVDGCEQDPASCLACDADTDCAWQGNNCTETVICGHREAGYAFIEIGCSEALEYDWPPDEDCACIEGACHITE